MKILVVHLHREDDGDGTGRLHRPLRMCEFRPSSVVPTFDVARRPTYRDRTGCASVGGVGGRGDRARSQMDPAFSDPRALTAPVEVRVGPSSYPLSSATRYKDPIFPSYAQYYNEYWTRTDGQLGANFYSGWPINRPAY